MDLDNEYIDIDDYEDDIEVEKNTDKESFKEEESSDDLNEELDPSSPPEMPKLTADGQIPPALLEDLKKSAIQPPDKALKGNLLSSVYNNTLTTNAKLIETIPEEHLQIVKGILQEAGITDYHHVVAQNIAAFAIKKTLEYATEAKALATYSSRSQIDESDVTLAIENKDEDLLNVRPTRKQMCQLSAEKNSIPLEPFKNNFGFHLPSDRFTLMQPTYVFDYSKLNNALKERAAITERLHQAAVKHQIPRDISQDTHYDSMVKRSKLEEETDFDC
uniref:Transcription initiation factor TFIID subunit 8 n=1 Tax=Parastrongyloides trichosuri TaxID=131310 RepID=A0A0N4ZFY4_PARTI